MYLLNLFLGLPIAKASFATDNLNRSINDDNRFVGEVLIPCTDSNYGVISDIDDTILHTTVVSSLKWRMLLLILYLKEPGAAMACKE
ncbi:MAG: hypothetical protein ACJAU2_000475 [Maribacter sp.]|jgi:hypothetical protein